MRYRAQQAATPFLSFLDWFERHKYGVIGTLTLHTLVLFTLAITSMRKEPEPSDRSELQLEVVPMVSEEEFKRLEAQIYGQESPMKEVTNLVSNITATGMRLSNATQQRIQEKIDNDLRELEEAEFERLQEERHARGEDIVVPELDPSKWDKNLYMEKAAEPAKVEGNAIVWHDLKDRTEQTLQVPGYMSKDPGQVAVRVTVEPDGRVRKAELDRDHTTTINEEMHELAINSARNARFSSNTNAPDPQRGTIYYLFLAQ